jgi:hypothetical protein
VTRYLDLAEYLWLAEQVTGVDATILAKSGRIDLADSALHAPAAGFGKDDFYPELYATRRKRRCSLWPPAKSTKPGSRAGSVNASASNQPQRRIRSDG